MEAIPPPQKRYEALLYDENGILPKATIWNDAARELLHCNGAAVLAQWDKCEEEPERDAFLELFNTNCDKQYDFECEITVKKSGGGAIWTQISVNTVSEIV